MQYRQLGDSDIKVPVVSLGAWAIGGWMWGGTDDDAAIAAIRRAIDVGITCIDTAPIYGMGHSECIVGKAIRGMRDQVVLATKCGLRWDIQEGEFFFDTRMPDGTRTKVFRNLKPDSIRYECEQSLLRLGVDVIDIYQCHWPDATTPLEDTMEVLLDLQRQGKIRAIGVSNFTVQMMETCLKCGPIVSDQPPYSLLRREIENDVLPFCVKRNMGILAYSPLAHGLLTGKITPDREFPENDLRRTHPWFTKENRAKVAAFLEKIRPIAEGHNATLGQLAVAWVIAQKGITSALVGARTPAQVEENARAAEIKLTKEELTRVREAAQEIAWESQ